VAQIVIIGAGLTGLSTAYYLEKQGFFDYILIEQDERPGGLLRSEHESGFTFDYTGHFLHCNDQTFLTFLHDIVSFSHLNNTVRKTGIVSHNVTTDYPFQMNLYGLPIDVAIDCIEKYVTRPKNIRQPSSFYSWILKHFGSGFGRHFFFPYNRKLLAYDLKKVHPSWTGRFLPSTNLASIIKGTIEKKPASGIGYNSSFYYPQQGGIESIIKKVTVRLKNKVLTNHQVIGIDPDKKVIRCNNGTAISYQHIVSTMPLNQLLNDIHTTSHSYTAASQKLLCNSIININLGFSTNDIGPMHWLYFPEKKYEWFRLGFWHNICPALAPQGHSSIYGEYSYMPGTLNTIKKELLTQNLINNITNFLGVTNHHIVAQKILHLDHAYVIYDAWREKNIQKILTSLKDIHIHSIGRYGEWKYSSMQEAVLDGKQVADMLYKKIMATHNTIYPARRSKQEHITHQTKQHEHMVQ